MTGAEHRCVCVCVQRRICVYSYTNTHTRAGVQTHTVVRGGLLFHSALAVSLRLPHSQKSLNFFLEFFSSKFESNCENLLELEELGRRLLLLLLVLLLLVLLFLLEEGWCPQPLLLLLWAECRFWVRSTAGITLTL